MKQENKAIIFLNLNICEENFKNLKTLSNESIKILKDELKFRCRINKREMQNIMNDMKGETAPPLEMGLLEFEKFTNGFNKFLFENDYYVVLSHLTFTLKSYEKSSKIFEHIAENVDILSNTALCRSYVACVYSEKLFDKNIKFINNLKNKLEATYVQEDSMDKC